MNNIEELKPCPFCGGDANLLTSKVGFLVECSYCWTSFLNGPVGVGWYRCKDEAAVAWNTRHINNKLQYIRRLEAKLLSAQSECEVLNQRLQELERKVSSLVLCGQQRRTK